MNRSAMRENAFKLIYSLEIQKSEELKEQIDLFFESNNIKENETIEYINDIIFGINKNNEQILKDIEQNLI